MRKLIIFAAILVFSVTGAGCGRKPAGPDGKVLAKINTYELTIRDFNDEARLTMSNKLLSGDPKKAKEELLDEIITKKVLLQEAQRRNFDKDRTFMKEIERYWEQALIKLMVREKTEEFSRAITVSENEVRDEYERLSSEAKGDISPFESIAPEIKDDIYNRKMQKSFDDWLAGLKARSDIKISKENL
jgi:hypothetical protein